MPSWTAGRYTSLWCATVVIIGLTAAAPPAWAKCGQVQTVDATGGGTLKYTLAGLDGTDRVALVLLVGGGGYLKLQDDGCPRRLKGNSLVRMRPLFHEAQAVTALVDAPSSHQGKAGLGAYRTEADHAADIGRVIAAVRVRTNLPVWLAGASRGTISAVNAASRLSGPAAPDGVILTSPVTNAPAKARNPWVLQSVFDLPLSGIRQPLLVIAHEADICVRTPPGKAADIIDQTASTRHQSVVVTGGPGWDGTDELKACAGRSPHGFVEQESDVAAGIMRFATGGRF